MEKKKFNIVFTKVGYAEVYAENEDEAKSMANSLSNEDVCWSNNFETTEVEEDNN